MALLVETFVLLFALGMTAAAALEIAPPYQTSAWLLPLIVGSGMTVLAALLVMGEARRFVFSSAGGSVRFPILSPSGAKMIGWLALSVGYGIATPVVGFEWATMAFLACALSIYARLSWWLILVLAIGFATVVPFVFRNVFFSLIP